METKLIGDNSANSISIYHCHERLKQTFSEGGAQEIYREIKAEGDFLGFARQYVFDEDFRVARSALWGLTKASDKELSELQVMLNDYEDMNSSSNKEIFISLGASERIEED